MSVVPCRANIPRPRLGCTGDRFPISATILPNGLFPYPESAELCRGLFRPATIGFGAGGAGMQDFADFYRLAFQRGLRPLLRKVPNRDNPLGMEHFDHAPEMPVARVDDGRDFAGRKFIGGAIAAADFIEPERTIIGHEMFREESLRRSESFREKSP